MLSDVNDFCAPNLLADGEQNVKKRTPTRSASGGPGTPGTATSGYRSHKRRHEISAETPKPLIPGSSESRTSRRSLALESRRNGWSLICLNGTSFGISTCVLRRAPSSLPTPIMPKVAGDRGGSGHFGRVVLRPQVLVSPGSDIVKARKLHDAAYAKCLIARSVNFPVERELEINEGFRRDRRAPGQPNHGHPVTCWKRRRAHFPT